MADSPDPVRSSEEGSTPPAGPYQPQTTNARQRNPDAEHLIPAAGIVGQHGPNGLVFPGQDTDSEPNYSLNDQFAASRQEFDFDFDEESERLEPAPVITDLSGIFDEEAHGNGRDIDDSTIRQLLDANDAEGSYDYYTLLGLTRDPPPTTADIRKAYHRVSLAFHPDKHPQSSKAAAERYFTRLQRAYETIVEPRKRVIYDMEGEEGLKMEYSAGGSMGKGGEAERNQIGVKTMTASEFKAWFTNILKERERQSVEQLVGANGSYKMTVNAVKLFDGSPRIESFKPVNGEGSPIEVQVPLVSMTAIRLKQGFSFPLPLLGRLLETPFEQMSITNSVMQEDPDDDVITSWEISMLEEAPKLTIMGSVGGQLDDRLAIHDTGSDAPESGAQKPVHWQELTANSVSISARLEHSFPETPPGGAMSVATLLQGFEIDVTTEILPKRTFEVGLGRMFSILPNTGSFYGYLRTSFSESLYIKPPVFDFRVSRPLGSKQTGYCQWTSGDYPWPSLLQEILPVSKLDLWLPRGRMFPTVRTGWIWSEGASPLDLNDDREPYGAGSTDLPAETFSNQSWHIAANASPVDASVSVIYGRDVFVRSPHHTIRSRIRNNGEAAPKSGPSRIKPPGGVRLEIETALSMAMTFGGTVRGVRRVGDFSSVGVGVGIDAERGLFISLSWSRLSQRLALPIILVPPEEVGFTVVLWALAVPWAAYTAVEFAILRPRLQRKRKRLVEKKRKELLHNVAQRKQEAEEAIALMLPLVEHRQAIERENEGLVIVRAQYGVVEPGKRSKPVFRPAESVDVTIPVAALVDNGQVSLPRGLHKSQLVGWWDPAPLKKKTLGIDYLFAGKKHHVDVPGDAGLSIPMRDHEL